MSDSEGDGVKDRTVRPYAALLAVFLVVTTVVGAGLVGADQSPSRTDSTPTVRRSRSA
ncbi:MAG: hypothetical protein ABEI99_07405 [Halobaculum sp.]